MIDYDEPSFGVKTFDPYGRHAIESPDKPSAFDVFRYISLTAGVHPSRLDNDYVGRHRAPRWGVDL
jgi:hypothetical protein